VIVDFMYATAVIRKSGTSALRSSIQEHHESNKHLSWELEKQEKEDVENAERRRHVNQDRKK